MLSDAEDSDVAFHLFNQVRFLVDFFISFIVLPKRTKGTRSLLICIFQSLRGMGDVIGIDVGTGSVRGALVSRNGKIVKVHTLAITTWNPKPDFYQQSSNEIWSACCAIIKVSVCN